MIQKSAEVVTGMLSGNYNIVTISELLLGQYEGTKIFST
jgi:hypothetical protein